MENDALKDARESLGLTQAELAKRLDTSADLVSDWERGIHVPRLRQRKRLCEILQKSPEELGFKKGKNSVSHDYLVPQAVPDIEEQGDEKKDGKNPPRGWPRRLLLMTLLGIVIVAAVGGGVWWIYSRTNRGEIRVWPTISYNLNVKRLNVEVIQRLLLAHGYDIGCVQNLRLPRFRRVREEKSGKLYEGGYHGKTPTKLYQRI